MNPYSNKRTLPVGKLEYKCTFEVNKVEASLEFGEKELIYSIPILINKPGIYCNLGELYGGSSILMAISIKNLGLDAKVYTVDMDRKHLKKSAINYKKHDVKEYIIQHEGTTNGWAGIFKNKGIKFQFVFIDASHVFKDVYNDIINYSNLLVPDGFIGFHDTNQDDVNEAIIKSKIDKWELVEWVNRIKLFRKPINNGDIST